MSRILQPWFYWFYDGYNAFIEGEGFLDNPHIDKQDDACRHWVDGYVEAMIAART